jgi:FMN phosphatase YigB (HAD superfamily)
VTTAIDAVVFDLFGTLLLFDEVRLPRFDSGLGPRPSTLPLLAPLLAEMLPGVDVGVFARELARVSGLMVVARQNDAIEWPSRERFRRALQACGVEGESLDAAAVRLSRRHLAALADASVLPAAHVTTLRRIRERFRVGIVTNFDDTSTVYRALARHDVLVSVDALVVSESVGLRKPHRVPFECALRDLDVPAAAACFVGDTYDEDVIGAQAVGMRAVWLTRAGSDDRVDATCDRIRTLPELVALLQA